MVNCLRPIRNYHLKCCLKSRRYTTRLSLCIEILNEIQYDKEEHQNQAYQGVDANLSPIQITDFFNSSIQGYLSKSLHL